jgi:hypothetical protein
MVLCDCCEVAVVTSEAHEVDVPGIQANIVCGICFDLFFKQWED